MALSIPNLTLQIAHQLEDDLGYPVDWWEDISTALYTFKVTVGNYIYSHSISHLALHTQRVDVIYAEMLACFKDRIKNERPAPVPPTPTATATAVVLLIPDDLDAPDCWI